MSDFISPNGVFSIGIVPMTAHSADNDTNPVVHPTGINLETVMLTDHRGGATNQDNGMILRVPGRGGVVTVIVVADGHGHYPYNVGEVISSLTSNAVTRFVLDETPREHESDNYFDDYFCRMFTWVNNQVIQSLCASDERYDLRDEELYSMFYFGDKVVRGGTTLTVTIIYPDGIVVTGNLGDSDAKLFARRSMKMQSITEEHDVLNSTDCLTITASHSPASYREKNLIELNADVRGMMYLYDTMNKIRPPIFDESNKMVDPKSLSHQYRLYFKNTSKEFASLIMTPGREPQSLAYTRSIGDYGLVPYGKTHKPSVSRFVLQPGDYFLVASDGFWDVHQNEVVGRCLLGKPELSMEEKIRTLFDATSVEKSPFGETQDNTTVIAVRIA